MIVGMTFVAALFAVTWVATMVAWYQRDRQIEADRTAERREWATALSARTPAEYVAAIRQIDPNLTASGAREHMARRRSKSEQPVDVEYPIGS